MLRIAFPTMDFGMTNVLDYSTLQWNSSNPIPAPSVTELITSFETMKSQEAMMQLRLHRNQLLKESDVYVLPDFPHQTEKEKEAWLQYRRDLRDLTLCSAPLLDDSSYQLVMTSVKWPVRPDHTTS